MRVLRAFGGAGFEVPEPWMLSFEEVADRLELSFEELGVLIESDGDFPRFARWPTRHGRQWDRRDVERYARRRLARGDV